MNEANPVFINGSPQGSHQRMSMMQATVVTLRITSLHSKLQQSVKSGIKREAAVTAAAVVTRKRLLLSLAEIWSSFINNFEQLHVWITLILF